jgi:hypothetical protein
MTRFKKTAPEFETDPFLPTYAEIGMLLGDVAVSYNLLRDLELDKSKAGVDKLKQFKTEFDEARSNDKSHHHKFGSVLDTVLSEAEVAAGFSKPVPTLGGIFTGEDFARF